MTLFALTAHGIYCHVDMRKIRIPDRLVAEWDLDKNSYSYAQLPRGASDQKFWWKCLVNPNHTWEAKFAARAYQKQGCPYCSGNKISYESSLSSKFPEIAKEWDLDKNSILPEICAPFSKKKIWWKCSKAGHSWQATPNDRVGSNSGCHICSNYCNNKFSIYNELRTEKTCNRCSKMLSTKQFRTKRNYIHSVCKKCEDVGVQQYRTMTPNGIAAEIVRRKKHECKKKNLAFDLTKEWVLEKLQTINWCCELTNLPMRSVKTSLDEKYQGFDLDSISVDRVRHGQGYTKDNVRFVLNQVNLFRQNGSDDRMIEIARKLIEHHDRKK